MSEAAEQPAPLHARARAARAALGDAIALTAASRLDVSGEASTSILAEYLITTSVATSAPLVFPRTPCAAASLVDLLAGCGFLAQLFRTVPAAALEAGSTVWVLREILEDHLEGLVRSGVAMELPRAAPAPDLDTELDALLAGEVRPPGEHLPALLRAETWAVALHQLRLPVTTSATAFTLLQAGFGLPGAPSLAEAVEDCVRLVSREPAALPRTAAFLVLLTAWGLRELADACALTAAWSGDELLAEVGVLLALRELPPGG